LQLSLAGTDAEKKKQEELVSEGSVTVNAVDWGQARLRFSQAQTEDSYIGETREERTVALR
jgi:hypothetical protein